MREVAAYTHWVPAYWRGKAHSSEVKSEFSGLFQYQVVLYFEEALSVVLLPWLCILLARSSRDIVSFLHKVCYVLLLPTVYDPCCARTNHSTSVSKISEILENAFLGAVGTSPILTMVFNAILQW